MSLCGPLRKMGARLQEPVSYALCVGEECLDLNDLLGQRLELTFTGDISCISCGRRTAKSYSQGHCFPCSQKLASCDMCIVRPERCHFDQGTCREPEWGLTHCMQPHVVYLANSSGLKVGITRESQIPTRWIDQGATQALPIAKVQSRYQSGLMEIALARHVADKTNWRSMLKGASAAVDLESRCAELLETCATSVTQLNERFGDGSVQTLPDAASIEITFPVLEYPAKVTALDFNKTPSIAGTLRGIKGQYLILDHGVLNVRKFTGYQVQVAA